MSNLSSEQLTELTTLINEYINEFEVSSVDLHILTRGVVRLIYGAIEKWQQEHTEAWAAQRISEVTITAEMAMRLSKQGYEMGYAARDQELQPPSNGFALLPENINEMIDQRVASLLESLASTPTPDANHPSEGTTTDDDTDINGIVDEVVASLDGDVSELAQAWPTLPNLNGGVDHFAEHPVTGETSPPKSDEKLTEESPQVISRMPVMETGMVHQPSRVESPLKVAKPRTLAEADAAELDGARMDGDDKAAALRDVLAELRVMSHDGMTMPTIGEWDTRKPPNMNKAQAIVKRHGISWAKLAEYAGLKSQRAGAA